MDKQPEILEVEPDLSEIEETPDGGAILQLDDEEGELLEQEFYDNIIDNFADHELTEVSSKLIEMIDRDKTSRKRRDDQYDEAIKRTGLGDEAPGGATFEGASKAVHPMLTEACIDFSSRTIQELLPADGPVKSFVPGEHPDMERIKKADRKTEYMNWQFIKQMPDFRNELEQLLTQVPLGGSQYLRLIWDFKRKRPVPTFVPIDSVYLPFAATNFYTSPRITFAEKVTKYDFEERVSSGVYRDIGELSTGQLPEETKSQKSTDHIEGREPDISAYDDDGLRLVYEVDCFWDLEDEYPGAPYLITIDYITQKVLGITRNWDKDDDGKDRWFWMVEFPFIPWRGAYSIGLGQMIGSLAGGATGALRALLDSALINNMPTAVKLKGANFSGQSEELNPCQISELEGGIAGDQDIRKLLMPLPFNQPSPVLYELLGFLVDAGRGVVRTTFDKLADQNPNIPVGTTLVLVEEGMRVMSAIYGRLFHAMSRVFEILHRINRLYLEDDEVKDDVGVMLARHQDFELPMDVIPVADPQVFSDVHRMSQLQVISDRAKESPDIYDRRVVEKAILDQTKVADPERFLIPIQEAKEQNAVNENAAMSLGRPVAAFPDQDHLAHLQVHLDYLSNPFLGQSILIAPKFIPMCFDHIKEHVTLWYVTVCSQLLEQTLGYSDVEMKQLYATKEPSVRQEMDRTLAAISQKIQPVVEQRFQRLPEVIQRAMQMMQTLKPKPEIPVDPNQQAALQVTQQIETQRTQVKAQTEQAKIAAKQQSDQMKMQLESQKEAQKQQFEREKVFMNLDSQQKIEAVQAANDQAQQFREHAARLEELRLREEAELQRSSVEISSRERMNREDNATALTIAAGEVASGEKVGVRTGTGINPNPNP